MPTEKFFNLREDKQRAIVDAACRIFQESNYQEMTVSQVIKEAEISRASFYSYFGDKEDMFRHMVRGLLEQFRFRLMESLEREKGGFYQGMYGLLKELMESGEGLRYCRLCKKIAADQSCQRIALEEEAAFCRGQEARPFVRACYGLMDLERYPSLNEERLACLLELSAMIIVKTMLRYFWGHEEKAQLEHAASVQLHILEKGIKAGPAENSGQRMSA